MTAGNGNHGIRNNKPCTRWGRPFDFDKLPPLKALTFSGAILLAFDTVHHRENNFAACVCVTFSACFSRK